MRNADRVHPEWQERALGDGIPLHPLNAPKLARFDANASFAFDGGWYFNLRAVGEQRTRLIARLLGLKARAERAMTDDRRLG